MKLSSSSNSNATTNKSLWVTAVKIQNVVRIVVTLIFFWILTMFTPRKFMFFWIQIRSGTFFLFSLLKTGELIPKIYKNSWFAFDTLKSPVKLNQWNVDKFCWYNWTTTRRIKIRRERFIIQKSKKESTYEQLKLGHLCVIERIVYYLSATQLNNDRSKFSPVIAIRHVQDNLGVEFWTTTSHKNQIWELYHITHGSLGKVFDQRSLQILGVICGVSVFTACFVKIAKFHKNSDIYFPILWSDVTSITK